MIFTRLELTTSITISIIWDKSSLMNSHYFPIIFIFFFYLSLMANHIVILMIFVDKSNNEFWRFLLNIQNYRIE